MGIRKDAFLRDCVRVLVAGQREDLINLYRELNPLYEQFHGNPDQGVAVMLRSPDRYPTILSGLSSTTGLSTSDVKSMITRYISNIQSRTQERYEDILNKARTKLSMLDTPKQVAVRAPQHTPFYKWLNSERQEIYKLLSTRDITDISALFSRYDLMTLNPTELDALSKSIREIFVRAYLRSYITGAQEMLTRIRSLVGNIPELQIGRVAGAYKVVLSYLNSIE